MGGFPYGRLGGKEDGRVGWLKGGADRKTYWRREGEKGERKRREKKVKVHIKEESRHKLNLRGRKGKFLT